MRILTVDDSRAIRSIVTKQVVELGFEVDEAENGEEGLLRLEDVTYDLVVLDVTMPVMDGPQMLAKMRELGNQTAVLMLTSESKRSVVGECLKLGISDYILKPFKPEELKGKVLKALKLESAPTAGAPPVAARPAVAVVAPPVASAAPADGANKQFIDILVVDDMENVQKKLRSLIPAQTSLNGCISAQSALNLARERVYRVVFLDVDIPDVDTTALLTQLRILQPHAAFVALSLRTANDAVGECRKMGFEDVLFKPFDKNSVDDMLLRFFDDQEIIVVEDNLIKLSAFTGREDRIDKYFERIDKLVPPAIEKIASACFEELIVDFAQAPARLEFSPRLVIGMSEKASRFGLAMRLVASPELRAILRDFSETAKIPCFANVHEARAA